MNMNVDQPSTSMELGQYESLYIRQYLSRPIEVQNQLGEYAHSPTANFICSIVELLRKIWKKFGGHIPLKRVFVIGSFAAHLFNAKLEYSDIDVMFEVDVTDGPVSAIFHGIRFHLLEALRELMIDGPEKEECRRDQRRFASMFLSNQFLFNRVGTSTDVWSLYSLHHEVKTVDIKFVHRIKREYQFSVDSLKIDVTKLMSDDAGNLTVESNFGVEQAINDVRCCLIDTKDVEEVFGGCFLKWCNLQSKNFKHHDLKKFDELRQKMLMKFQLDANIGGQKCTIKAYMRSHFQRNETVKKLGFLKTLKYQINLITELFKLEDSKLDLIKQTVELYISELLN